MYGTRLILPLVLLFSFLGGCSSTHFPSKNVKKFTTTGKEGLLIASVTMTPYKAGENMWKTIPQIDVFFDVYRVGDKEEGEPIATLSNARHTSPLTLLNGLSWLGPHTVERYNSQFDDQDGQVFALVLLPGKYVIKGRKVQVADLHMPMLYGDKEGKETPYGLVHTPFQFEVAAGEAVYLGNIDVHVDKWIRYKPYPEKRPYYALEGISVAVTDMADRDIPVFMEKFDNLNLLGIGKRILAQ